MRIELEVRTAVVLLLAVLVITSAGGAIASHLSDDDELSTAYLDDTVDLEDGSILWPYTSQAENFDERTLPINLVIYGDAEHAEYILRDAPFSNWEDVPEERQDLAPAEGQVGNGTTLGWGGAQGADRYSWVDPPGEAEAQWLSESYQLESGDYLGARQHIRAYEDPDGGEWVALQAHSEHWDWFHLRHTVHSVEDAQNEIEAILASQWYVNEYYRGHFENDRGSDANGWVTIVDLDQEILPIVLGGGILLIGGVTSVTRDLRVMLRSDPVVHAGLRAFGLATFLAVAYLAIRFGALALERFGPEIDPKLIVLVFYPTLVVGMPILAYMAARRLEATVAFWSATVGFAAGVLLDYTYLGVMRLPVETFIHRFALAIAIGMIAAGASQTARYPGEIRGYVRTGVLLWIVAVVLPLLQFL